MSKLILNPDYRLYERNGQAYCSSRQVAEEFERRHDHILRLIDELTAPTSGVSADFTERNFSLSSYKDASGKKNREILMTKDGFVLVAMEIKAVETLQRIDIGMIIAIPDYEQRKSKLTEYYNKTKLRLTA